MTAIEKPKQAEKQEKIGILGGTFDPIHLGHLRMALELAEILDLSEVRFIPSYQPVHRSSPIATPEQRLTMLQRAIASEPLFKVDTCEIDRKNSSYMIHTLEQLHSKLPDTVFCLLLGSDAFLEFTQWHGYQAILEIAHLVVAHRPYFALPEAGALAELVNAYGAPDVSTLTHKKAGVILTQAITPLDISATFIRQSIVDKKNPRYLLPDRVYDYILQEKLYQKNNITK